MIVVHCGDVLPCLSTRELKPTDEEAKRGVVKVKSFEYCCTKNRPDTGEPCNSKLYYKQEVFELGVGEVQRIKKCIAAWVSRIKRARSSDWVEASQSSYPFLKVKRSVQ